MTYFGGKAKIAAEVWRRLGDVPNFVEPFFGSGAVLLKRPSWHRGNTETVNDLDGMISNFWRAITADPVAVAEYADWPILENDLHARHLWLVGQKQSLQSKLEGDPDYYDAKIAGWWVWGMSCWIGSGFCSGDGAWSSVDGELVKSGNGVGVARQRPQLSGEQGCIGGTRHKQPRIAGRGVTRKRPILPGWSDKGVHKPSSDLIPWFEALSARLRHVRVCCGDWSRVMGPSVTHLSGMTGVFLDPPYSHEVRDNSLYAVESGTVAADVRTWCIENGDNPLLRIALCGYEEEHTMPKSWTRYRWHASGGYGNQNKKGNDNKLKECTWFSPHCLKHEQGKML